MDQPSPRAGRAGAARRRAQRPRGLRSRARQRLALRAGAKGRRHRHATQEETFVVLAGALSLYVGEPPERIDVPAGGLVRVDPGTPLQSANHGDRDLLVYAHGYPPENENAQLLDSAV